MDMVRTIHNADAIAKDPALKEMSDNFHRMLCDMRKKPLNSPRYAYILHGALCYSPSPPKEFFECEKAIEDFRSNPPIQDPTFVQQQNDSRCLELFTRIQSIREELADHVLVEPMAVMNILLAGCWAHLNFKAKHKDADDSSSAIYFAELAPFDKKVTCLVKLDIDLSADTSAYKCCSLCHQSPDGRDRPVSGVGCVYHPVGAKLFLN